MKHTIYIIILPVLILLVGCTVIFAQPAQDDDIARQAEFRVDRLTMVLADKAGDGVDTKTAEDLLLKAIDLIEDENYLDAMGVLDQVCEELGIGRRRSVGNRSGQPDGNRPGIFGDRPQNTPMIGQQKELTLDEKSAMKNEISQMLNEVNKLVNNDNYDEANELMREIHMRIFKLSGKRPMMGPGTDRLGREGGPGQKGRGGFGRQGGPGPGQTPRDHWNDGNNPGFGRNFDRSPKDSEQMKQRRKARLDRFFERVMDSGSEGFEKAVDIFDRIADKLDGKGTDNSEAVALRDKAVKQNAAGGFERAVGTLRDAFDVLLDSIAPETMRKYGEEIEKVFSPGGWGTTNPKPKSKD